MLLVTGMSSFVKCPSRTSARFPPGSSAFACWFVGNVETYPGLDSHTEFICSGESLQFACSFSSCCFDDHQFSSLSFSADAFISFRAGAALPKTRKVKP